MIFTLVALIVVVAALLVALFWGLRGSGRECCSSELKVPREGGRTHIDFLPQMRQALKGEDAEFLARAGVRGLRRRVSRERRRVALSYLSALRQDFEGLMHTRSAVAGNWCRAGV